MKNLTNQVIYAINENKAEGENKTNYNQKISIAKKFGSWMEANHKEITSASDITAEHTNEFLLKKADNCRPDTLQMYIATLKSIAKCINKTYCSTDEVVTKLERATGARMEELTNIRPCDIRIHDDESASVFIRSEQLGRPRTVDVIGKDNIDNLRCLCALVQYNEPIVMFKKDSLKKAYRMHISELRKEWAQRTYDNYHTNHTMTESLTYISQQLGHSRDYDINLINQYVADIY